MNSTLLLCGARAIALASFRLRSIDLEKKVVDQDGRLVRTKGKKRIVSWFFPVGADMLDIVEDWVGTLSSLGYAGVDPLFPADKRVVGRDGLLVSTGLSKNVWESAMSIRKFFKRMCEDAGIPCNHPHAIRRSLVKLAFRSPTRSNN
jgi:integrase